MTDIPAKLQDHLSELQDASGVAESLIDAIVATGNMPQHGSLRITLAEEAQAILKQIGRGLDSVTLEKVTA
jgi:hypothetical protein